MCLYASNFFFFFKSQALISNHYCPLQEVEEVEEEEEEEEDEDDDDEDEPEDPNPALREQAAEGVCHSFKHHFEECVERVTAAQEEPDYAEREYKEDCVEEFFHLEHCINDQTAGSLFKLLK